MGGGRSTGEQSGDAATATGRPVTTSQSVASPTAAPSETSPRPTVGPAVAAATADTNAMAGLLQQLVSTMSVLTARMNSMEEAQARRQAAAASAVPSGVPPVQATVTTGSAAAGTVTLTSSSVPTAPIQAAAAASSTSQPAIRATRSSVRRQHHGGNAGGIGGNGGGDNGGNNGGDGSPDDDSSDEDWSDEDWSEHSSSSSDASDSSDDDDRRRRDDREDYAPRRSVKDLELPSYSPSPNASVSVWIDRVELVMEGARRSGRGDWSDRDLYYILGNKLVDNAAKFYTTLNRRLRRRERTWSNLRRALLRRYGERVDKSAAEFRVAQRFFAPGETYADFAAGLREAAGRARVRERVLLAQFYRCLNMTVRALVEQRPEPKTLEEAVDKAMQIDKTDANVARAMTTIGQFWPQAPAPGVAQITGNVGTAAVLPGVGSTQLPGLDVTQGGQQTAADVDPDGFVAFTNPRGTYNNWTGIWEAPKGRTWNGRQWIPSGKAKRGTVQREQSDKRAARKPDKKAKAMLARKAESTDEDEDESDAAPPPPKRKRQKAAVRQAQATAVPKAEPKTVMTAPTGRTWTPGDPYKCYACGRNGHYAKECPDAEARARNDAYLAARNAKPAQPPAENEDAAR